MIAAYDYLWFYLAFVYFAISGLVCSSLSTILYVALPRRVGARFGKWMIHRSFRRFLWLLEATGRVKLDLSALDSLRGEPGLIIAPNHPSILDAAMVISRLPNVACVLKTELMNNVLFGAGARLARYIRNVPVRRMVRQAVDDFDCGSHLLLFPEGTRTTRRPLNAFKGSIGLIATHAQVPVQTVLIETDSLYLGKGWSLWRKPPMPIHYRLRLGRRFDPPQHTQHFMTELEQYFEHELAQSPASSSDGTYANQAD